MAGLKNTKGNSFKSVELDRIKPKAENLDEFINNAEGETSIKQGKEKLKVKTKDKVKDNAKVKEKVEKTEATPKPKKEKKREKKLLASFTKKEVLQLKEMAKAKNMRVIEFVRHKIFHSK